jgi:predicted MFS family arabinose efflux permease
MTLTRFGRNFPRLFFAAILQELSFAMLIHVPGYFSDLGATESRIGVLYAASAVASLLFRPLLGRILDLTHRRTVLLLAAVVNIMALVALSLTNVWGPAIWTVFLIQRTVQFVMFTGMLTYAADSIPLAYRTQGLAIYGLSGLIPIAIGGLGGDILVGTLGFDGLFLAGALTAFTSWLLVWMLPTLPVKGRQPRRSFWAALAQRDLLPVWFISVVFAVGMENLFTYGRTFVEDRQVGTAGILLFTYGMAAAITRIVGGGAYDRWDHRRLLVWSIAGYGVGFGVLAITQTVGLLVLGAILCGTGHGVAFPLLSSEVVNRARVSERGSAMSTFTAIFDVAVLVSAPAVGFLIDGFDYLVAFSAVGLALVIGTVVYTVWDRRIDHSALVVEEVLE